MFGRNKKAPSNERRRLTPDDVASWDAAADQRKPNLTRDQIIERVKARNPHRWWRIQQDYRWLEKQMISMGLNPHDARELL